MYNLNLPPSVKLFYDLQQILEKETDKKNKRKMAEQVLQAKQNIIPQEMADSIFQIPDTLLKSKVASLVLFTLGENNQKGFYQHLTAICKKYPHGGIIEPEQQEVYHALVELGFSKKASAKMSTPPKEN